MKSGQGNGVGYLIEPEPEPETNILVLLAMFSSRAMENAAKYVDYCGRNGVTATDVVYGMRYEVFEFTNNPNNQQDAIEIEDELDAIDDDSDSDWEDIEDIIVPDGEIESYCRINPALINDYNRDFVMKMHSHYDQWDQWVPDTPLLEIMKRSIDKANNIL
jgi:hypothetical protein